MRVYERDIDERLTGEIDLSRIARVLAAKRWWVIGPVLAALAAALVFVNVVRPRYSAEARLLLENQESFLPHAEKGERASEVLPDAEAVQSQIQLLTSRDLARRVIKALQLQGDDEFDPLAQGVSAPMRLMIMFGLARDPTVVPPEDRILDSFAERLNVLSPTKTRVLSIEFSSRNPDLAARGANAIAEAYIAFQQDAKRESARSGASSLASLVAELRGRVAEAEARAEEFRVKSGLLLGVNNTTISAQHLSELNTQLSMSRSAQADAQAKARLIREMLRQNRVADIPDVANNEVMRRLTEQRVTLRAQLALESRTLLPGHPRIKELQAQLDDLDRQTRAAAERVVRTLENDARIAGDRVENLTQALEAQKKVVGAAGADDVQLRELERTARLYKEQLESAVAKYQEAIARENAQATPADARIFQRALAPQTPSFPKKIPIVAFAGVAALILSVGAILSAELLSGRPRVPPPRAEPALRTSPELAHARQGAAEAAAGQAAVALDAALKEPAPVAAPVEAFSRRRKESGNGVATARAATPLSAKAGGAPCVKVLFTRGDASPAASATMLALARGLAQGGRAVLVAVDLSDAVLDQLAARGEARPKGLRDLLAGVADFGDVIQRDPASRLHLIAAGSGAETVAREAQRANLAMLLEALARTYDFVVFATGDAANTLRLAPMFDKVLLRAADPAAQQLHDAVQRVCRDVSLIEDASDAQVAA